jgi:glutathione synthase
MRLLFVTDPVAGLDPCTDTSVVLMRAAEERGHEVLQAEARDVALVDGSVVAEARPIDANSLLAGPPEPVALGDLDAVLVRVDPPFDHDYLTLTWLLDRARTQTCIVNDPRGLRDANEKLYACRFPDLMPPTLVSSSPTQLLAFAERHHGAVLKPIDGHAGRGVVAVLAGDGNGPSLAEALTDRGRRAVMAQRFLPGVRRGDKRILVLDGKPLGPAVLRVPADGDFRANLANGATVKLVDLDDDDRRIVRSMADDLRRDGLWFVGIDVIDGCLTEVNVTSPTGLRQLCTGTSRRYDHDAIASLETRAAPP